MAAAVAYALHLADAASPLTIGLAFGVAGLWAEAGARSDRIAYGLGDYLNWLVHFLIAMTLLAIARRPVEPDMQLAEELVRNFGMVVVIVPRLLSATGAFMGATNDDYAPANRFFRSLALYAFSLWGLGAGGDLAYRFVEEAPMRGAAVAAAGLAVWMIYVLGKPPAAPWVHAPSAPAMLAHERRPSERDVDYIAAHEAGHALTIAGLGGVPEGVHVAVRSTQDSTGNLGYVVGLGNVPSHLLQEKVFQQWMMVLLLAGKAAEVRLLGSSTSGTASDHAHWLSVAKGYLANFNHGIFYLDPTDAEVRRNEEHLVQLQTEQLHLVYALFDNNMDVLRMRPVIPT